MVGDGFVGHDGNANGLPDLGHTGQVMVGHGLLKQLHVQGFEQMTEGNGIGHAVACVGIGPERHGRAHRLANRQDAVAVGLDAAAHLDLG